MKKDYDSWNPNGAGSVSFNVEAQNGYYTVAITFSDGSHIKSNRFEKIEYLIAWSVSVVGNYLATHSDVPSMDDVDAAIKKGEDEYGTKYKNAPWGTKTFKTKRQCIIEAVYESFKNSK